MAFRPDDRLIVTGVVDSYTAQLCSADRSARLWEVATGKPVGSPRRHRGPVCEAAFSPDGRHVVTGSADGTARLWDVGIGRPIGEPLRNRGVVRAVAFGPDGKLLATAGAGGRTARLWKVPLPLEGDVERIVLWVQVITGLELDSGDVVRRLDAQTWQQRQTRLGNRGGPP